MEPTWNVLEEVKILTNVLKNTQTAYSEYSIHNEGILPLASKIRCKEHAQLMAAAPEMLELLTRMESYLLSKSSDPTANGLIDSLIVLKERIQGGE